MDLLDVFITDRGDEIEIYYLPSFRDNANIYNWFLSNCRDLVNAGKASSGWNFEEVQFHGVIALHGSTFAGHYAVRSDDEMRVLTNGFMFVEMAFRRHRVADALLRNLSRWGKDQGYRAVLGEVHYSNQEALAHALATGHRIMPFYTIVHSFK
jgi:GNAT superfamily N-acetyltransferase